jgi:tetratricopeptide (TPR) repeat protein
MIQDYPQASNIYEQLIYTYPEVDEYKFYFAQCLYKEGNYDTALRIASQISNPKYQHSLTILNAYIRYELEELANAKSLAKNSDND